MSRRPTHGGSQLPSARQRRLAAKRFAKQNVQDRPIDLDGAYLVAAMRAAAAALKPKNDSAGFFIAAAEYAILECLRLPHSSSQSQEFFARPPTKLMSWEYSARIFSFADTLFTLKDCDGFDFFCAKARESDLRATVSEMHAARLFADAGFAIKAVRPISKKKSDFDFLATKSGQAVSVEVSGLAIPKYDPDAIVRKLRDKRKQVPDDLPAVIFLVVPEQWGNSYDDELRMNLRADADTYFGMTQAINAVVFMTMQYKQLGENPKRGRTSFLFSTYFNDRARHNAGELLAFIDGTLENHPHRHTAIGPEADIFTLSTEHQKSPFFDWARSFWHEEAR